MADAPPPPPPTLPPPAPGVGEQLWNRIAAALGQGAPAPTDAAAAPSPGSAETLLRRLSSARAPSRDGSEATPRPGTAVDDAPPAVAIDVADLLAAADASGFSPFFVALVLLFLAARHLLGLLIFATLAAAQAQHSRLLTDQAALKAARSRPALARVAAVAAAQAVAVAWLLPASGAVPGGGAAFARAAVLLPPRAPPPTLAAVLFLVTTFDAGARLATTAAKASILAAHAAAPAGALRARGAALSAADAVSAALRAAWSTSPWLAYLSGPASGGLPPSLTAAFVLLYAGAKVALVARSARTAGAAVRGAVTAAAAAAADGEGQGLTAPLGDVEAGGGAAGECAICYTAPAADPTRLSCSHTFCSACVERWLETHSTCPLCRSEVRPPGASAAPAAAAVAVMPQIF